MLKEVREQPEHIRAVFMWLSVFIVFSAVVFIWVNSFQQRLVFMLAPAGEKAAVEKESPFAMIGSSFGGLKAAIFDLLGLAGGTKEYDEVIKSIEERVEQKIKPRLLPVSE